MKIVNTIKSIPGLDMAVAMNRQLAQENPDASLTAILHMESPCIRVHSCGFLLQGLADVCDEILLVGNSKVYEGLADVSGCRVTRQAKLDASECDRLVEPGTILLRSHADIGAIAAALGERVRARGGVVLSYLEGCYPPLDSIPLPYFSGARPDMSDIFLLYSEGHRTALESVGYRTFHVLGYPKMFPGWKAWVRENVTRPDARADSDRLHVAIFTRGEFPGEKQHIMPHETLSRVLNEKFDALEALGRPLMVQLKPHPGQDVQFLQQILSERPYAELSYEYPALLASWADLVTTTWSTTIVDAVTMGTPAIEFYPENDYFRQIYPAGSYTKQLGVPCVQDGDGFREALHRVLSPDYSPLDPARVLGDTVDFSVFG